MNSLLSVSDLTRQIKDTLERGFTSVSVVGEISNFKPHAASGHWYFNLKDNNSCISCSMWRSNNTAVFFTPQDGMKVILTGRITVYAPRGSYQIDVKTMRPAGVGELQQAFEMLKQKLFEEGLFRKEYKKQIPAYLNKIGIVTASDGAALQDMISVAKRRFPLTELIVYPARVQGSGSYQTVINGIKYFNSEKDVDVIVLARGGGSIEDLWAFNEEELARAIFASDLPVITGIGHEVDFTIADFVADLRAPTPSAAMEIITPDKFDILKYLEDYAEENIFGLEDLIKRKRRKINEALGSYGFRVPVDIIRRRSQDVDNLIYMISQKMEKNMSAKNNRLSLLSKSLEMHDVNRTLKRGFVLVKQGERYIKKAENLDKQLDADLRFIDGEVSVKIK